MTGAHWRELMSDDEIALTMEEKEEGWHFCQDWDGLLIGPGMEEVEHCHCLPKGHTFYWAAPMAYVPFGKSGRICEADLNFARSIIAAFHDTELIESGGSSASYEWETVSCWLRRGFTQGDRAHRMAARRADCAGPLTDF